MFFIKVVYPSAEEELAIARTTTGGSKPKLEKVIDGKKIIEYQQLVRRVPVPDHIYEFVVKLVRSTRPGTDEAPEWLSKLVTWGAGPRAVQYLILGAKAHAVLNGNYLVGAEDVEAVAPSVLTHRILLSFHAETEGLDSEAIIKRLTSEIKI
jgi:MoxR-like ATPase